jgi:hypothetical protein
MFPGIDFTEEPGGEMPGLLEKEEDGAGLPGAGSAFGQEDLMAGVGEAALFEEGGDRRTGTGEEILIKGFEEGVEAAAEVEAAVVALDGEEGNLTPTLPSTTFQGFSAISKFSEFGEGACRS